MSEWFVSVKESVEATGVRLRAIHEAVKELPKEGNLELKHLERDIYLMTKKKMDDVDILPSLFKKLLDMADKGKKKKKLPLFIDFLDSKGILPNGYPKAILIKKGQPNPLKKNKNKTYQPIDYFKNK